MSVLYGNGYDRCGPLSYAYLGLDGQTLSLDVFGQTTDKKLHSFDEISMSLTSYKTGTTVTANATLTIELEWYPSATSANF